MESIQGQALVASPYLTDPNFMRSVVYILRHDEEGAIGLLLNRPTTTTIGDLLDDLAGAQIDNQDAVFYGGPVEGPLMLLSMREMDEDTRAIHVASDQQHILDICNSGLEDAWYRVFDGYSGWSGGQLEEELKSGGWLIWGIQPEDILSDPEQLWQMAIREIGRDLLAGGIDPSKIPEDPAYN